MYFQIAFVTSTLLNFFAPQIADKAALKVFGAKRPLPAFFNFLMEFFEALLRLRCTSARCAACALSDGGRFVFVVVFVVALVVVVVVFFVVVVFVISVGRLRERCTQAL